MHLLYALASLKALVTIQPSWKNRQQFSQCSSRGGVRSKFSFVIPKTAYRLKKGGKHICLLLPLVDGGLIAIQKEIAMLITRNEQPKTKKNYGVASLKK